MQKLALIAFNSKIGMKLILDCYAGHLSDYFRIVVLAEKSYPFAGKGTFYGITDASSHFTMFKDTVNPFVFFRIFRVLKKERPDICYFISAHPLNPFVIKLARFIAMVCRQKITVISHIHDIFPHKDTKGGVFIDFFQRRQIKYSDKITVYGNILKATLEKRLNRPSDNIIAVRHGAGRIDIKQNPENRQNKHYVSFIGRIDRYKGINTFLEVAEKFDTRGDVTFYLGGNGDLSPHRDKINRLTNLQCENMFLTNERIDEVMSRSYAVILPYIEASQSGVIPLAYYNACPVIATKVGGLPEYIEEGRTGFLVEPSDVNAIYERITRLMDNETLRLRMQENCFRYYQENLQWPQILSELAGVLAHDHNNTAEGGV